MKIPVYRKKLASLTEKVSQPNKAGPDFPATGSHINHAAHTPRSFISFHFHHLRPGAREADHLGRVLQGLAAAASAAATLPLTRSPGVTGASSALNEQGIEPGRR